MSYSDLSGILSIIKPVGIGSTKVVSQIKHLLKVKKCGHGGTLDPFASGLLPIGINKGTKYLEPLLLGNKTYFGIAKIGIETDTLDCDGLVTETSDPKILSKTLLKETAKSLLGKRLQETPLYSARRINGKRLYEIARSNLDTKTLELPKKEIEILRLEVDIKDDLLYLEVECSKGTYIRQLVKELLEPQDQKGHLIQLVRKQIAKLNIDNAISIDDLTKLIHNQEPLLNSWFLGV